MEKLKRFNLQEDAFVKERFQAVRDSVEELKQEYPEILSINLYGSLVKGNTREDSDIDGIIYIDTDLIETDQKENQSFGFTEKEELDTDLEIKRVELGMYLTPELYDKYGQIVQTKVIEKNPNLKKEQVEHMRPLPMSEEGLNEVLNRLVRSKNIERDYEYRVFSKDPTIKSLADFRKAAEGIEKPERLISTPRLLLGSMFLLEVGGGIRKYRKQLIERLLKEGKIGEAIWRDIIGYVEKWEQKVKYQDLPTDIHYPRTLEEAKLVFG